MTNTQIQQTPPPPSELHELLLTEDGDLLLTALLSLLADAGDQLDEEEIDQLPMGLQYWEGHREWEPAMQRKVLETLYQVNISFFALGISKKK